MNKDFERYSEDLHRKIESVLVLQGGGSLGAYECGVYKCLYKNQIKFEVLAGSSIGAVNASIICAAQKFAYQHSYAGGNKTFAPSR